MKTIGEDSINTPDSILNSMEKLGIVEDGTFCDVRISEITWKEREETREPYYVVGEPKACGGRIFFSKTQNKRLPCGNCAIRGVDCVEAVVRLLWKERGTDEDGILVLRNFTNKLIVYSGFEKAIDYIYEKARKKFEYRLNDYLAEKAKRDKEALEKKEYAKKLRSQRL